jgi:hypothetical protein
MGPPKYGPMPNHPVHIHPVRPFYRFMATGLGASMWFFVCRIAMSNEWELTEAVDVPREEGRPRVDGLEAPVGSLIVLRQGRTREDESNCMQPTVHTNRWLRACASKRQTSDIPSRQRQDIKWKERQTSSLGFYHVKTMISWYSLQLSNFGAKGCRLVIVTTGNMIDALLMRNASLVHHPQYYVAVISIRVIRLRLSKSDNAMRIPNLSTGQSELT